MANSNPMAGGRSGTQVFDRHFLELRGRLLEVAAILDRVRRADDNQVVPRDQRWQKVQRALEILASDGCDRAERIQMLFSDPYDSGWQRPGERKPVPR